MHLERIEKTPANDTTKADLELHNVAGETPSTHLLKTADFPNYGTGDSSPDQHNDEVSVRTQNSTTEAPARTFYQNFTRWLIYNKTLYKSYSDPNTVLVKFTDGVGFGVSSIWPAAFTGIFAHEIWRFSQQNVSYHDSRLGLFIGQSSDTSMWLTNHGNYAPYSVGYWVFPTLFTITPFFAGMSRIAFGSPSLRRQAFERKGNDDIENLRKSWFGDYRLWSIGEGGNFTPLHILYWFFNTAIYVIDVRIVHLIAMRFIYLGQFFSAKRDCEQQHKVYTFLQQLGEYDCTICGDWSEVYTPDVFSSQGCLDGLVGSAQPYEVLASGIHRLLRFGNFSTIDFSKQNWPQWNDDQWQLLLNQITNTTQHLASFNLSLPLNQVIKPSANKANFLAEFIDKVFIDTLDLYNTWNGTVLNRLCSTTSFSGLTYLDISYCGIMDDVYANNISRSLPNSLTTLKLSGNLITDEGNNQGLNNLRDSNLIDYDISYNQLLGLSFPSSKSSIPQKLSSINFAGNDFSQSDLTSFWELTCDNSTITQVSFQNTAITDLPVITAAQYSSISSVTQISFADNHISDYGISQYVPSLVNTSLTAIDFSGNAFITDDGLEFIAPYFIDTVLKIIKFDGINLTKQGLSAILQGTINSSIESISIAVNKIQDDSSQELSDWACQPGNPVRALNLSNNHLTSLNENMFSGNLTVLWLSGNKLNNQTKATLFNSLPNSGLKNLGLNNVGLTEVDGVQLSTKIPGSALEVIDIGNNFLLDVGTTAFAGKLIEPSPQTKALADSTIGLKFIRWLAKAAPNTKLKVINLENNGLTASGARAFCRVIPGSRVPFNHINLLPNVQVNPQQINLNSCRFQQIDFPGQTAQASNLPAYVLITATSFGTAAIIVLAMVGLYYLVRLGLESRPKVSALMNQFGIFPESKSRIDADNGDDAEKDFQASPLL